MYSVHMYIAATLIIIRRLPMRLGSQSSTGACASGAFLVADDSRHQSSVNGDSN